MSFDTWCSPPEIADPLEEFYEGPVDVDPCSNSRSIIRARVAYTSGGLVYPWCLPPAMRPRYTGYENDPYSMADVWTRKMLAELRIRNLREHIRLSMFACSTKWWADMCREPKRNPRILALKRIPFLDPRPEKQGEPPQVCRFEPALTYFGPRPERFTRVFAHLTRWTTWGR